MKRLVNMMYRGKFVGTREIDVDIPEGTTHIWTPGVENPITCGFFRRSMYKKIEDVWFSYNRFGEWVETQNTPDWFVNEEESGYLVTKDDFLSPNFVMKSEDE